MGCVRVWKVIFLVYMAVYTYVALAAMLFGSLVSVIHVLTPSATLAPSEYDSRKLSSSTG